MRRAYITLAVASNNHLCRLVEGWLVSAEGLNQSGFSELRFSWLRYHEPISQLPRYVMDQHTSRPTSSVSRDAKWWLSEYTSDRLKRKRTMKRKNISENETPVDEKKKKRMKKNYHDVVKNLNSLPVVEKSEIDSVIRVFNGNSQKAPVVAVVMVDGSLVVMKMMKKDNFGYGAHQNFVQNVKDAGLCNFRRLHPLPDSGKKYRGLVAGCFDIAKNATNPSEARVVDIPGNNDGSKRNVFFVTGCVTQNEGGVVDTRFSHCPMLVRPMNMENCLEIIDIIAFRMLLCVNDTNHSNILIGEKGKLYSVDENKGRYTDTDFFATRGCQYLKKILRERLDANDEITVRSELPRWMFGDEEERTRVLNSINRRGIADGISKETLDSVAYNSTVVGEKLMQFLFP